MSEDAIIVSLQSLSSQLNLFQSNISGEIKGLREIVRQDIGELRNKIDGNRVAAEHKIDELIKDGCAQGRLDRQDVKTVKADIRMLKNAPDARMNRIAVGIATLSALVSIFLGVMAISKGLIF